MASGTKVGSAYLSVVPKLSMGFGSEVSAPGADHGRAYGERFSSGAGSSLKAGAVALGNILADVAKTAASAVMGSIDGAIARVDTFNSFRNVMAALGEDSAATEAAISTVKASLDGLPSTSQSIIAFTQQVKAAGLSLGDATELTVAMNNAMLAGGQGTQAAEGALTQFTQALAKGKFDMQDWRSLVMASPAAMDQLAKSILGAEAGQNDLYEALKDGDVAMGDFTSAVVRLNREGYEGFASFEEQARAATKGIGTSMDNFKNRITQAMATVVETLNGGSGGTAIASALDGISSRFGALGQLAGRGLSAVVEAAAPAGAALMSVYTGFMDGVDAILRWDAEADGALGPGDAMRLMVEGVASALGLSAEQTAAVSDALGGFADFAGEAFTAAGDVLDVVRAKLGPVMEAFGRVGEAVSGALGTVGDAMGRAFGGDAVDAVWDFAWLLEDMVANSLDQWAAILDGAVCPAIEAAGDAVAWVVDNLDVVLPLLGAAAGAFAAIRAEMAISGAVSAFQAAMAGAGEATGILAAAQRALNAAMNANPIMIAVTVLAALAAALITAYETNEDFRAAVDEAFGWIAGFVGGAIEAVGGFLADLGGFLADAAGAVGGFAGDVAGFFGDVADSAAQQFDAVQSAIAADLADAQAAGTEAMSALSSFLAGDWDQAAQHAASAFEAIKGSITGKLDAARDVAGGIADRIGAILGFPGLGDTVRGVFDGIRRAIEDPIGTARNLVHNAIEAIKGFFNFRIEWPHIPLPHFYAYGSINPLDWITQGPPSIGIDWYAKGGVFPANSPRVIGIGDAAEPEAAAPISDLQAYVSEAVEDGMGAGALVDELRALREDVRNLKLAVYMDSRKVAGEVYPYIGERAARQAGGMAWA